MAALTQSPLPGDVVKWETNPNFNREMVTLKSGAVYAIGSILGLITASGKFILSPNASVTGSEGAETAAAVLIETVDASGADALGLVVRRGPAIVADTALIYDGSVDNGTKKAAKRAQLVTLNIVPRVGA